jgi:hypothetical protein
MFKTLVTFAERSDFSSAEGCMGLNAISEFGQWDADVTRITRNVPLTQRHMLTAALRSSPRPPSSFLILKVECVEDSQRLSLKVQDRSLTCTAMDLNY